MGLSEKTEINYKCKLAMCKFRMEIRKTFLTSIAMGVEEVKKTNC